MTTTALRRLNTFIWMLATTIAGLVWRLAPLHLPFLAYKYGGSMLWAIALYFLIATALPHARLTQLALITALVSALVEFSRLYHTPAFDAFRQTLAGKLLLGRFFSLKNIVAYWLAIAIVAAIDSSIRRKPSTA
jgi:hypothetical protein